MFRLSCFYFIDCPALQFLPLQLQFLSASLRLRRWLISFPPFICLRALLSCLAHKYVLWSCCLHLSVSNWSSTSSSASSYSSPSSTTTTTTSSCSSIQLLPSRVPRNWVKVRPAMKNVNYTTTVGRCHCFYCVGGN